MPEKTWLSNVSTEKVWDLLDFRLHVLDEDVVSPYPARARRQALKEAREIVRELKMRGVQLQLPLAV